MSDMAQDRKITLQNLARRLATAWRTASTIDHLADAERPRNRSEAYFVQDAMAAALNQPLSGWKVGATSARMRELDGHDDVIPGRILQSTTYLGTDLQLPAARFPAARVETEFAFRLTADIAARTAPWTAQELAPYCVLHPAIEIIGQRYPRGADAPRIGSLETIADNGGGIGFVFGDGVADWRHIDFQQHHIDLRVDAGAPAENFLGELRCVPIQALADLVNHLAARGFALRAGDFVSTGAATVPQAIVAGSRVVADFGTLGRIELRFV
jgi:2-keto-4-pentenoate hydratase